MNIAAFQKVRGVSKQTGIRYGNDDTKSIRTRSRNRRRNRVGRRTRKVNFGLISSSR